VTWLIRLSDAHAYLPLSDRPLLTYSTAAVLLGAQMLSMGILAEMLTAYRSRDEDTYSIAEHLRVRERPPETAKRAGPKLVDGPALQQSVGSV
jgi:hypothetical protein